MQTHKPSNYIQKLEQYKRKKRSKELQNEMDLKNYHKKPTQEWYITRESLKRTPMALGRSKILRLW
jgi:hypothetical protein